MISLGPPGNVPHMTWTITTHEGSDIRIGLVDDDGSLLREHPIEFLNVREAHRAVDRLNARDFG
jgi:hypothetical protein